MEQKEINIPGMEEAAEKFFLQRFERIIDSDRDNRGACLEIFIAGAKWMAEQGITVEGNTDMGLPDEYFVKLQEYLDSLPKGSKIFFQIRKA